MITKRQDVEVFASRLDPGAVVAHKVHHGRHAWVQVIEGAIDLNSVTLATGDGAAVSDGEGLRIRATTDAHFLLFDLV